MPLFHTKNEIMLSKSNVNRHFSHLRRFGKKLRPGDQTCYYIILKFKYNTERRAKTTLKRSTKYLQNQLLN